MIRVREFYNNLTARFHGLLFAGNRRTGDDSLRRFLATILFILVAGCERGERFGNQAHDHREAIAPAHFAIVPCRKLNVSKPPPCQLLAAGGKYFLLGAPEGVLANLLDHEIKLLDGVLLFSLLPHHIDGLDTVRNETWRRGRDGRLLVTGPEGTELFVGGIDSAYETPDAELFAVQPPPGGYDASLMQPREILDNGASGMVVVDTGDLTITGMTAPSGQIAYLANYEGVSVAIGMCGGPNDDDFLKELTDSGLHTACNEGGRPVYYLQ